MPQLEIYRMPYEDLVDLVRQAMEKVHLEASVYEDQWSNTGDTVTDQAQKILDRPPHLAGALFDARKFTRPTVKLPTSQPIVPEEESYESAVASYEKEEVSHIPHLSFVLTAEMS